MDPSLAIESPALEDFEEAKRAWALDGVLVAKGTANPFELTAIQKLRELCLADFATRGDATWHEHPRHHSLYFLRDRSGETPKLQGGASDAVMALCNDPETTAKIQALTGLDTLQWRVVRYHRMQKDGQFIAHRDTEENPDYKISIVLGLNDPLKDSYQGGHTVTLRPGYLATEQSIVCRKQLVLGDAYIMQSGAPHLVEPVLQGYKDSLVLFGSDTDKPNKREAFSAASRFYENFGRKFDEES